MERGWAEQTNNMTFLKRFCVRIVTLMALTVVALFVRHFTAIIFLTSSQFPYFLDFMGLVSGISVSLSGYILPCLFYWKICRPPTYEKFLLVFVMLFGLVGSGVGIYLSIKQLISDVQTNPNPFDGLFHF